MMKKKLVFFPSDPLDDYLKVGWSCGQLEKYYNPGDYFDEVYCLSPWKSKSDHAYGKIRYICARPEEFKGIIKEIHPAIVRGYGGYCCADWAAVSKVPGIPVMVSVHDTNPELIYPSLIYADALICMSDAVKDAVLNKLNIDRDRIFVMPNRVDTRVFKPKSDIDFFEKLNRRFGEGKHLLHIGRKAKQKNLDTVIKAMGLLGEKYHCIFVGRGDTKEYEDLAVKCGVREQCHFIESIKNEEIPLWLSWCDYMCTPSRWEGFGIVFIEAAACEAAIITSDIPPMNEYLEDGKNAFLVKDYENPQSIADAIMNAEMNHRKVQQIKKAAREVGLKFSKEKIDTQEAILYENTINGECNDFFMSEHEAEMVVSKYGRYK